MCAAIEIVAVDAARSDDPSIELVTGEREAGEAVPKLVH